MAGNTHEHSRCPPSRDAVPVRPGRPAAAATRPPAAGATLSDADPLLFAAHHAIDAFPALAAGSAKQLRRAAHVPRQDRSVPGRDRSGRRDGRLQPLRLLSGTVRRTVPLRLRAVGAPRPRAVPARRSDHASSQPPGWPRSIAGPGRPSTRWWTSTAICSSRSPT